MGHKVEHAVDLASGAVVAVTIHGGCDGDTQTIESTLEESLGDVMTDSEAAAQVSNTPLAEIVADKGYHSNAVLVTCKEQEIRTYIPEPKRGRRNWKNKAESRDATYANRRRARGKRGKALMRTRGEKIERTFAHSYDTGGMRRLHLRGHTNTLKRLLVHNAALNLGLLMRQLVGFGTPRSLQGRQAGLFALLWVLWAHVKRSWRIQLPNRARSRCWVDSCHLRL